VLTVSVVIPCYNSSGFVGRTLASVLAQTLDDLEVIVVDDGSTDEPAAVVEAVAAGDPRVRIVRQENQGLARTRNKGARLANDPRYFLFLDADDILDPPMLATMVDHLDRHPAATLAYCVSRFIDPDDHRLSDGGGRVSSGRTRFLWRGLRAEPVPDDVPATPFESLMAFHTATPSTCVIRASAFRRTTGWLPGLRAFEDKQLVLEMAGLGEVHFVNRELVGYRLHGTNMSSGQYMDEELAALTARWWRGDHAPAERLPAVRRAILFDTWLTMTLQAKGAVAALGRRDVKNAARLAAQAGNNGRRFAWRYARAGLWRPSVRRAAESPTKV
jgi:glycosyltransferase involved in cell wall biosynthesis